VEYWGLRSYLKKGDPLKQFEIGSEPHPQEYILKIADVFDEIKRIIKPSATVWLNCGDTMFGGGSGNQYSEQNVSILAKPFKKNSDLEESAGFSYHYRNKYKDNKWLQPKQRLLIPHRIAIEMQSRGWILRNDLIWRKLNFMPSSVKDRLTNSYEFIFLFVKNPRYYFNLDAVRLPHSSVSLKRAEYPHNSAIDAPQSQQINVENMQRFVHPLGKNPSDFLTERETELQEFFNEKGSGGNPGHGVQGSTLGSTHPSGKNPSDFISDEPTDILETTLEPTSESHYAKFPSALPRFCLKAGCPKEVCSKCGKPREAIIKTNNPLGITGRAGKPMVKEGIVDLDDRGNRISPGHDSSVFSTAKIVGYTDCGCENKELIPGTVLDPFLGSGTTLQVAQELGLNGIGIELNPPFASIMLRRLNCRTKIGKNKFSNPLSEVEFISEQEINYEIKKENLYMPGQKKIFDAGDIEDA